MITRSDSTATEVGTTQNNSSISLRGQCVLFVERVFSAIWRTLSLSAFFLFLSLVGFWALVPGLLHGIFLVGCLFTVSVFLWRDGRSLRFPSPQEGLRHLERKNSLTHRPLTSINENLSLGDSDPLTTGLWREHTERLKIAFRGLRIGLPNLSTSTNDPWSLGALSFLFVFVGAVSAGADWQARIAVGFAPSWSIAPGTQVSVDAWVDPPPYTHKAPIFLAVAEGENNGAINVPQGAELIIRTSGPKQAPRLNVRSIETIEKQTLEGNSIESRSFEIRYILEHDIELNLKTGSTRQTWHVSVTPDRLPAIAFAEDPKETEHKALQLAYTIYDDYGVKSAEAIIRLSDRKHPNIDTEKGVTEDKSYPSGADKSEAMSLSIPVSGNNSQNLDGTTFHDLTAHPWAGLPVSITLIATDDLDQVGESEKKIITLPERSFHDPLARALVEQRRNLASAPSQWREVTEALDALTLHPQEYFDDTVVYLGIRNIFWSLTILEPESFADATPMIDLMWYLALRLEDGDVTIAARELREIQQALLDALAAETLINEIQKLLQEYREALERYLQALAQASQDTLERGEELSPFDPNTDTLTRQDLDDLLEAIEGMAQSGDAQSASDLLSSLQRTLENLQASTGSGQGGAQEQAMGKTLDELGDMIGKERDLLDDTFQGAGPDDGEDSNTFGGSEPRGALSDDDAATLAERQKQLSELLGRLGNDLNGHDVEIPAPLKRAEQAMEEAREALSEGDAETALDAEKQAIEHLREGAKELAQELMSRMAGSSGDGAGQPNARSSGNDPLGRPTGRIGRAYGDDVLIPTERELKRAREILDELQRRASDPTRAEEELDYLERLLKRF